MTPLYKICYNDCKSSEKLETVFQVDTKYLNNKELLRKNNLKESDIQSLLDKKNIMFFYRYAIFNEELFKEVKKFLFYRTITGEVKAVLIKNRLYFTHNEKVFLNSSTAYLYENKFLTLREIKKFHDIFSNYVEEKDYATAECLYFKKYKYAKDVVTKIINYPYSNSNNYYYILNFA
jgi:hypothetical protein